MAAEMDVEVDGRTIHVTHADRVVFPAVGVTKGELVQHYERVAPLMVPFLRGRPVSMQRVHDSIASGAFYQKAAPSSAPEWVHRVTVPKKGGTVTHAVCDDAATLVYLANQNCITPHVWLSREPDLDKPDRLIVDLDPGPAGLEGARSAAVIVRDALTEAGLAPYLMATGSNGFHVVTPIEPAETFDRVAEIAWQFAALLASRSPDLLTTEFYKEKRGARVYLDMARNTWAQTAVPPYAVRVRANASVAVPLAWDELDHVVPDAWTVRNIVERLDATSDPWAGIETHAASIDLLSEWIARAG
jgi:bifunctional non-homologous end joining protein LigD